ncbi:MAG: Glutaredoxin [Candidatus Daviesbacteria bacterium GW2011_GWF2_38_6]|uniref:Glutaredoxin n=1 Tax=Candidatus Daviesbacteria bacterium GW2011_GWF2_38_6 TaxID=1618432 RepID=A0A0G0KD52_9BACT|nr:MAG: Glutaredoxin [Candidatus Daviesbacteria bacterium GW2011_GWF2_38_6]
MENYPGFTMITGADLAKKFKEELMNFENDGLWIKEGVEVVDLSGADPDFLVKTSDEKEYHGKTVIIASGRIPKMLGIPGEKELLGKGVAIIEFAKGSHALTKNGQATLQKVARSVTIINITDALRGDEILMKNVTSSSKVKILNNHEALEILGDQAVGGIKIKNKQTNEEQIISVSGVFIEIGWTPSTSFDKLTDKNDKGEIEVDNYGATSVPGIYACGDVNDQWGEQIVIAAGEGAKTGLRVAEHLSKVPHQQTSNIHEG